jgi:hypothetical protein
MKLKKILSIVLAGALVLFLQVPANYLAQNAGTGNISPLNGGFPAQIVAQWNTAATKDGATTTATLLAAPGTGIRAYITEAQCVNSSASTVSVAKVLDGSTVIWYIPCPAAGAANAPVHFNPPLRVTSNAAVGMAVSVAITTAYLSASGYTSKF